MFGKLVMIPIPVQKTGNSFSPLHPLLVATRATQSAFLGQHSHPAGWLRRMAPSGGAGSDRLRRRGVARQHSLAPGGSAGSDRCSLPLAHLMRSN